MGIAFPEKMKQNGLHHRKEGLQIKFRCSPPGCVFSSTLSKKMKKYSVTVFLFLDFLPIYKGSSEFWIKVDFSVKVSDWASKLVAWCRVSLPAKQTPNAFCPPIIDDIFYHAVCVRGTCRKATETLPYVWANEFGRACLQADAQKRLVTHMGANSKSSCWENINIEYGDFTVAAALLLEWRLSLP